MYVISVCYNFVVECCTVSSGAFEDNEKVSQS